MNRKMGIGSLLLVAVITLAGCGVQSYVEKDPSVDLRNYRTFAWINERGTKQSNGKPYKDFRETYLMDLVTKNWKKTAGRKPGRIPMC